MPAPWDGADGNRIPYPQESGCRYKPTKGGMLEKMKLTARSKT